MDLLGLHPGGLAQHHLQKAQVVHPDVQQSAPAQLGAELPFPARPLGYEAVLAADPLHPADGPLRHQLPQPAIQRQEPGPQGLHQEQPLCIRQGVQLPGLGRGEGKRLFAQHVLSVFQAEPDVRVVPAVGGRHIDRLHRRVGGQRLIGAVGPRDTVPAGKSRRALGPPGTHRRQRLPLPFHLPDGGGELARNVARCQNAPFHQKPDLLVSRLPRWYQKTAPMARPGRKKSRPADERMGGASGSTARRRYGSACY